MKRFLLFACLTAAFPLAFAQSETVVVEPFIGGGLSLGVPGGDFALSLQGGADNVLGGAALRGVFNIDFEGEASVALDIINYFPETRQLAPYLGGGGKVFFSGPAYGLHALGGLDYSPTKMSQFLVNCNLLTSSSPVTTVLLERVSDLGPTTTSIKGS